MHYPEEARKQGMPGTVFVNFVVDETGRILDAQVLKELRQRLRRRGPAAGAPHALVEPRPLARPGRALRLHAPHPVWRGPRAGKLVRSKVQVSSEQ
ncbi:MAG: TonB family protein [Hymenobacter sp.]